MLPNNRTVSQKPRNTLYFIIFLTNTLYVTDSTTGYRLHYTVLSMQAAGCSKARRFSF